MRDVSMVDGHIDEPKGMSDNEIIKALECCIDCKCKDCPCYNKETDGCKELDEQDILDLINRQKAEIERLKPFKKRLLKPVVEDLVEEMVGDNE